MELILRPQITTLPLLSLQFQNFFPLDAIAIVKIDSFMAELLNSLALDQATNGSTALQYSQKSYLWLCAY